MTSPDPPAQVGPNELPVPSDAWDTCSITLREHARQPQGTVSEPRREECEAACSQLAPGTSRAQAETIFRDHFSAKSFFRAYESSSEYEDMTSLLP